MGFPPSTDTSLAQALPGCTRVPKAKPPLRTHSLRVPAPLAGSPAPAQPFPRRRQAPGAVPRLLAAAGHANPSRRCARTRLKPPAVPLRHSQTRGRLRQHEALRLLEPLSQDGCRRGSARGEERRWLPLPAASSPGSSATLRTVCSCTARSQPAKWPWSKRRDASVPGGQSEKVSVNAPFTRSQRSFRKPGGRPGSGNGSGEQSSSSRPENKGAFMQCTMAGSERGQDSCESRPRKPRPSLAVGAEIRA